MNKEIDNCLNVIQEECAEMIQVISKIKRFGFYHSHPKHNIANLILFAQEYGDLQGAIDKLISLLWDCSNCDDDREFYENIANSREEKPARIDKYFKYSCELNNV